MYRDINIVVHLYTIDAVEYLSNIDLPFHKANRNYKYIDYYGKSTISNEKNAYKFEKFIFESFNFFDNLLVYRVNKENNFAPIKSKEGMFSPENAVNSYIKYYKNKIKN